SNFKKKCSFESSSILDVGILVNAEEKFWVDLNAAINAWIRRFPISCTDQISSVSISHRLQYSDSLNFSYSVQSRLMSESYTSSNWLGACIKTVLFFNASIE